MGTSIDELLELLNGKSNKEDKPCENTNFKRIITRRSPASSGIYNSVVSDLHKYINDINSSSIVNTISLTIPDKELQWSDLEDNREHFLHNYKEIFFNSTDYFSTLQDLAMDNIYLRDSLNESRINKSISQLYTYKNYLCFEKNFNIITGINNNRELYEKLREFLIKICDNVRVRYIEQIIELKKYICAISEESELNQYEVDEGIEQLSICFYKFFCFIILLESKAPKDIDINLLPVNYIEYDQNVFKIRIDIDSAPNEKIKLECYESLYECIKRKSNEYINKVCNDCYTDFFELVNQRRVQDDYLLKDSKRYRSIFKLYELFYDNIKYNLYRNYNNIDSNSGLMRTNLSDRQLILDYFKSFKSDIHTKFSFERMKSNHRIGRFVLRLATYDDFDTIIKLNNPTKPHRRMIYVKSSETEIRVGIENNSIWVIEEELDDGTQNMACVTVLLKNVYEPAAQRVYSDFSKDTFNDEYEKEYYQKIQKPFSYIDFNSVLVNNGVYGVNSLSYRGCGFQRLCLVLAEELAVLQRCDFISATVSAINKPSMRNFLLNGYKKEDTKIYRLDDEQSDYYRYITSDKVTAIDKTEYAKLCGKEVAFLNSYYENYNITQDAYMMDKDVPRDFVVLDLSVFQNEIHDNQKNEEYYMSIIEAQKQEIAFLREEVLIACNKIDDDINRVGDDVNSVGDDVTVLAQQFEKFTLYFNKNIVPALNALRRNVEKLKDVPEKLDEYHAELDKGFAAITKQLNDHFSADTKSMQQAEEKMQAVFDDTWNRLLPESRTSLCSAHLMWERCNKDLNENFSFDWSGVCILATSALEREVKRVFSDRFEDYLNGTGQTDLNQWPRCLCYKDKNDNLQPSTRFMLGNFQYMIGAKKDKNPDPNLSEKRRAYLNAIIAEEHLKGIEDATVLFTNKKYGGKTFAQRCDYIANNYRNKAAHDDTIDKETAGACYDALIPSERAKQTLNNINNLLIILYRLIDDNKMKKYLPNVDE